MIRGLYTGASGMIVESLRTDTIANNMANVNTSGFKKDVAVTTDFASLLIRRIKDTPDNPAIGTMGAGALVDEIATIQAGGPIHLTGNNLDMAITGNGFFTVQTPNGVRYTRNGEFSRNARGELVTQEGYRVLGRRGPVRLNGSKVSVRADGTVFVDDVETDRLRLAEFADRKQISKEGSSLYRAAQNAQPRQATGEVEQGYLEGSNANVVSEMINMIASTRAYEVNAKVVQTEDSLLDKAVNEVGKV